MGTWYTDKGIMMKQKPKRSKPYIPKSPNTIRKVIERYFDKVFNLAMGLKEILIYIISVT